MSDAVSLELFEDCVKNLENALLIFGKVAIAIRDGNDDFDLDIVDINTLEPYARLNISDQYVELYPPLCQEKQLMCWQLLVRFCHEFFHRSP